MADVTESMVRVLCSPDTRALVLGGAEWSATSEAGPIPGDLENSGDALWQAGGEIDTGQDLEIVASRSGGSGDAAIRWRAAGESLRSWDPPTAVSDFEFIDRSTTAGAWARPHGARLPGGRVCVVATSSGTDVVAWRQSSAFLWSQVTIKATGSSGACASVVALADGRLVCVYTFPGGSTTGVHLQMSYSDDDGASWTVGSAAVLDTRIATAPSNILRLRLARLGSDLVLFVVTTAGATQYASTNGGARFTEIGPLVADGGTVLMLDCASGPDDVITVAAIVDNAASFENVQVFRLLSVFTLASEATATMVDGSDTANSDWASAREIAVLADDDGVTWLYAQDGAGTRETVVTRSLDGGATWLKPWKSSAPTNTDGVCVTSWGVSTTYPKDFAVIPERSRALFLHRWVLGTATADDSLCVAYLGGWTTVAQPEALSSDVFAGVGGWDFSWLGAEKPDNTGWTRAVTGAPTAILGTRGVILTQGGGETQTYSVAPTTGGQGAVFSGVIRVDSGTGTAAIQVSDGTWAFAARVQVTTTGIQLYDELAAALIGSATATTAATNGVAIVVCVDAPSGFGGNVGRVRCHYRALGNPTLTGPSSDREWASVTGSTTLTRAASAVSAIRFGAAVAGVSVVTWLWCGYSAGTYVAGGEGLADPARGRQVACPVHIDAGLTLELVAGTALTGDTMNYAAGYSYPVEALDVGVTPSPRRSWRATAETAQTIRLDLDFSGLSTDIVGLWIDGANWRTAQLWTSAGKVADIDLGYSGLNYTRTGGLITPTGSGSALPWYVRAGSLDGATLAMGTARRRVSRSRAGRWNNAAPTGLSTALQLASYDSGDPIAGTAELWMPRALVLVTGLGTTDWIELRIDAQATADGYLTLGKLALVRPVLLGQPYGWGHASERMLPADVVTARSGARSAYAPSPPRRAVEIDWTDGIDMHGLYTSPADPDFVRAWSSGPAQGDVMGQPSAIDRYLTDMDGSVLPGVLCMGAPRGSSPSTPITVLDPSMLLYGRCMTQVHRTDTVLGTEGADPGVLVRVGVLRIEEEL